MGSCFWRDLGFGVWGLGFSGELCRARYGICKGRVFGVLGVGFFGVVRDVWRCRVLRVKFWCLWPRGFRV